LVYRINLTLKIKNFHPKDLAKIAIFSPLSLRGLPYIKRGIKDKNITIKAEVFKTKSIFSIIQKKDFDSI